MTNFIIRRLIQTVIVVFLLSFVTYAMMGMMPGDPLDIMCAANPRCTPENVDQMKKNLGLDRPIHERYFKWAKDLVRGDFGYSRTYRVPVKEILGPSLFNTIVLGILTMLVSFFVAIPLGIFTSLRPRSAVDYIVNMLAFVGISAPSFWLGLILIIIFSVSLEWFPAGGVYTINASFNSWWDVFVDRVKYLVLPVTTLSLLTIASWVRFTRASMLETLHMDYIRTAKAKGLTNERVIMWHALRNALLPVVTVVTLSMPSIISGAVITESVFTYDGIGQLMYKSILNNDFNVAMCCFIMICFVVLLMSLVADVLYAYLDPRISYH